MSTYICSLYPSNIFQSLSSQKIFLLNILSVPPQVIALSVVGLVVVVVAMVIMIRTLGTMILHQVWQIYYCFSNFDNSPIQTGT